MKVTLLFFSLFTASLNLQASNLPADGRVDIWPTIPFIRGADLCRYKDAYGQTRTQYMNQMVQSASQLMRSGSRGKEALQMLVTFNEMYDRNLAVATQNQYLDVTLESTLKSYISEYYRNLRPKVQKISFNNTNDIMGMVNAARNGQRDGYLDPKMIQKLDFIGYGTYALAPNCQGDIQVTLHLVGQDGDVKSYIGQGIPSVVMSQIASRIFEDFQRTQFPSSIRVGNKTLKLVGALNGSVDKATSPQLAETACQTLDARLPSPQELDLLDAYGDWSGGVSLGEEVWALTGNKVFAPMLRNPSPIREVWEVNARSFSYYCVAE